MAIFDPSKPSIARVYDYLLGGKDHYSADRKLTDQLVAIAPVIPLIVRENKQFLQRAVTWTAQQGIDQFIDLGCGMPTAPSTQETAQATRPGARVAYIENDPVVICHLKATLGKDPAVTVIDGDLRDADAILRAITGAGANAIDLARPAGLMLGMVLHFIELEAGIALVRRYVEALAPGSYLIASVAILDDTQEADKIDDLYSAGPSQLYRHKVTDINSYFGDLEMVPPGIADTRTWEADRETVPETRPRVVTVYGGVAWAASVPGVDPVS